MTDEEIYDEFGVSAVEIRGLIRELIKEELGTTEK